MFILSQDKTRIFNTSGHIEGIGYKEENFKEGKKEEIRHTIQVFDGCAKEIGKQRQRTEESTEAKEPIREAEHGRA